MKKVALLAALLLAAPAAVAQEGKPAPKKEDPKAKPTEKAGAKAEPKKPAPEAPPPAVRTPRTRKEALLILEQVAISVNFDETPLRDAVNHLSVLTGVNMVLGPALIKEGDPDALKVTLRLRALPARQVLELMADSLHLGIGFQGGVLLVTTPKEARGKPVLRLYAIGDLAMPLRDFPAPDLMLKPAGAEVEVEEEKVTKHPFSEPEDLLALVKDHTGTGTWSDEGVSASTLRDWLVVRQYPEVHDEIASLLAMVRAAR